MAIDGTSPYPWPFDGELTPTATALVICGAGPTWSARTALDGEVVANLALLRSVAAAAGLLTVLVTHGPPPRGPIEGLPDPSMPRVTAALGEVTVTAAGTDGFYGGPLDVVLRRAGRTHMLVAGNGLETAVHSTLRRANDRGYECLTVGDACAAIDGSLRAGAVSSIELSGGIFGAVGSTAAVVAALRTIVSQRKDLP